MAYVKPFGVKNLGDLRCMPWKFIVIVDTSGPLLGAFGPSPPGSMLGLSVRKMYRRRGEQLDGKYEWLWEVEEKGRYFVNTRVNLTRWFILLLLLFFLKQLVLVQNTDRHVTRASCGNLRFPPCVPHHFVSSSRDFVIPISRCTPPCFSTCQLRGIQVDLS